MCIYVLLHSKTVFQWISKVKLKKELSFLIYRFYSSFNFNEWNHFQCSGNYEHTTLRYFWSENCIGNATKPLPLWALWYIFLCLRKFTLVSDIEGENFTKYYVKSIFNSKKKYKRLYIKYPICDAQRDYISRCQHICNYVLYLLCSKKIYERIAIIKWWKRVI